MDRCIWAIDRVTYWWKKCCENHHDTAHLLKSEPYVSFSNKLTRTAGLAYTSKNYIKLSIPFLMNESLEDYDQTIGHEVAHIFTDRYYHRRCIHNNYWKNTMIMIGLQPRRCHQYKSTKVSHQNRFKFKCVNGHEILLTQNRVTRMKKGSRYICTKCKGSIMYD